ncbi:conserved hypothetical protein [Thiomonas sp. X19]|nr:conserved hypothetical protein [Thiomonas sp. X19]
MPSQCLANHRERSISAPLSKKTRRTDQSDSLGFKSDSLLALGIPPLYSPVYPRLSTHPCARPGMKKGRKALISLSFTAFYEHWRTGCWWRGGGSTRMPF